MAWKAYGGGGGPTAPVFPRTTVYVAGIPMDGRGNAYSPNSPKGVGYKANGIVRPGDATLTGGAGGSAGLKFK